MKTFSKLTEEWDLLLEAAEGEDEETPEEMPNDEDSEEEESDEMDSEEEPEEMDSEEEEDETEEEREPVEITQEEDDEISSVINGLKELTDEEIESPSEFIDKVAGIVEKLGISFDKEEALSKLEGEEEMEFELPLNDEEGEQTEVTVDSIEEEINGEKIGGDLIIRFTKDGDKITPEIYAYFTDDEAVSLEDIDFEIVDSEEEDEENDEEESDEDMSDLEDELPMDTDMKYSSDEEPIYDDGDIQIFESKGFKLQLAKLEEENKYVAIYRGKNGIRTTVIDLVGDLIPIKDLENTNSMEVPVEEESQLNEAPELLYVTVVHGLQKGLVDIIEDIMGGDSIESEGYTDGKKKWQIVVKNLKNMSADKFKSMLAKELDVEDWLTVANTGEEIEPEEMESDMEEIPDVEPDMEMPEEEPEEEPVEETEDIIIHESVEVKIGEGDWQVIKTIKPSRSGYSLCVVNEAKEVNVSKRTLNKFLFRETKSKKEIAIDVAYKKVNPFI